MLVGRPWLYGLAGLLVLLCPLVFLGVWVADGGWEGFGAALLAGIADLVAAVVADQYRNRKRRA